MFTIKFYSDGGQRQKILEAESFTILRWPNREAEITLHQKDQNNDKRYDIKSETPPNYNGPPIFQTAVIANLEGKTIEVIPDLSPEAAPLASPANLRAVSSFHEH